MPACILGVINLRGQVIPVVDLRARLGVTVGPLDDLSRIMIARLEAGVVGLGRRFGVASNEDPNGGYSASP